MKKYWKLLLMAAGIGIFTACEDVPEPYNIPTEGNTPSLPTADYIINQTFTSSLGDFKSQATSGSLAWTSDTRYGAIISGYQDFDGDGNKENKPGETYLISPEIDLTEADSAYVIIEQAINYAKSTLAEDHHLLIRVGEGDWAELPMNLDGLGTSFTYLTQNIQIPDEFMGKKIQLALKHTAHNDYSSTWEVKSLKVAKGTAPEASVIETPVIEGVGSGTKDDPYDVPTTIKLIAAGPPSTKIYTKGIVSQVDEISDQYGNATYFISNDGTTKDQLEVYRGFGLGGEKFKAGGIKVGDEVIVYGQVVYYNNKTMEFTQGSELYSLNGVTAGGSDNPGEAKGSGTLEDPYNGAAANAIASALAADAQSDVVYIKGKISSIKEEFSAQYGNATFYLSDDGTSTGQFYIFRSLYLGNKKWTNGDTQIKVGDEVVVCAKLTNYKGNTPETVQGETYLYSLNGKTEGGETPEPTPGEAKGSGTLEDPFNSVAANNIASALAADAKSEQSYYIKGKVVSVKESFSEQYGNATFYISDDGTSAGQFYVFRALYLGNQKWVSGNHQIKAGDEVVVYAQLTNYKGNTPETVQGAAYIYSLNGKTEDDGTGGGEEPGPTPGADGTTLAQFTNGGFEAWTNGVPDQWQSTTTASTKNTISQSTDAHSGSYSVQVAGTTSGNNRLGSTELALEAGEYTMKFFVKPEADGGSVRPGYVPVTDGKVGSYVYGDYTNDIPAGQWTEITHTFSLSSATTVNLVIMNPKKPGKNFLIDDFTITKN